MKPKLITELGIERRCTKCGDYWPDDAEFFYTSRGKTQQPCKACYAELPSRAARKQLVRTPYQIDSRPLQA